MSPLPDGYSIRPPYPDEAPPITDMANAEAVALIGVELVSVAWVEGFWRTPSVDMENDVVVVAAPDGSLAGYMFVRSHPPFTRVTAIGLTAIDHHGRGVGGAVVDESERRAKRFVDLAPAGAAVVIHQGTLANEPMIAELLTGRGYREVRIFWQMEIPLQGKPEAPAPPDGFDLRPLAVGEEEAAYACLAEAFQDHWGDGIADLDDWRHEYLDAPTLAPHLWTLAWHGQELAGVVLGTESAEENPDYGYIAQLGVRPAYRRRGLGEALLRQSFVQFHQADRAGVLLFVDAQSLTGATRLYERVGMASQPRFATWEKELRPGDRAQADG
jgi:mycothiol synthase